MPDERILVSMKGYIGDAVMTAPLVRQLSDAFSEVTVKTSAAAQEVIRMSHRGPRFLPLQTRRWPWSVWMEARSLRGRFSTAILVNRSFRSALTARLAGIPRRIGHAHEGREALLTDVVEYDPQRFEAWCSLDLLKPLGIEPRYDHPQLIVTADEEEYGETLAEGAVVGVQPGARFEAKRLPEDTVSAVCRGLQERGHKVVLLGGKDETEIAGRIAASMGRGALNLVGKTDIRQAMALARNLRLVLGSDTGLLHLAAGVGTPVIQVLRPNVAAKWGHAYGKNRVLQAPEGRMDLVSSVEVLRAALEVVVS